MGRKALAGELPRVGAEEQPQETVVAQLGKRFVRALRAPVGERLAPALGEREDAPAARPPSSRRSTR